MSGYEYRVTEGMRKCWDGEPDLSKEGWEEYREWERFDFTEQRYWRKKKMSSPDMTAYETKKEGPQTTQPTRYQLEYEKLENRIASMEQDLSRLRANLVGMQNAKVWLEGRE